MSNKNKIRWTYTTDMDVDYAIAATKAITDQVGVSLAPKVGGSAAATSVPRLPPHIKPRYVKVSNGGVTRRVICYEKDADLFTGVETSITLEKAGADVAFTRDGGEAATIGQKGRDTCKQNA